MSGIITATLVLGVVGILVGVGLVFTGKKFAVEVDEREVAVRAALPGNNCGACGYAGCDAMAAAIASGDAPVNGCPVGGAAAADKIGEIMGVKVKATEKKVAFVRCSGTCDVTHSRANYIGIQDCRSALNAGLSVGDCEYGCMGYGTCTQVCPENAIHVENGVAVVDRKKCVACGLCIKACPKGLIELVPAKRTVAVRCANKDKGPSVRKNCAKGCLACGICVKQCEANATGAMAVLENLARVDYDECVRCGICAEKCPSKVIEFLEEAL